MSHFSDPAGMLVCLESVALAVSLKYLVNPALAARG